MTTQLKFKPTTDWKSINAELSIPIGTEIRAQVIKGKVNVASSDTKPNGELHGFVFSDSAGNQFFESEKGAKECWIRAEEYQEGTQIELRYG